MTSRRPLLFALLVLAFAAACERAPTHPDRSAADGQVSLAASPAAPVAMCANQSVPPGYAVVGTSNSRSCPDYRATGTPPNVLTIQALASPVSICLRWPIANGYVRQAIPAGYIVVSASSSRACPYFDGGTPNVLTIRTPTSPTAMCLRWPIPMGYARQDVPADYVVVGASSTPACPYYDGNSPNALTIRTPASPTTICLRWPIPMGYVSQNPPAGYIVSGTSSTSACPYYNGNTPNALTIRTPASPSTMCLRWPTPTGYIRQNVPGGFVTVGASSTPACPYYDGNSPNALTIRTPASPTTICLRWPIPMGYVRQDPPAGFMVVGATSTAACPYYDGNSPNALTIRAAASPSTMCLRWPIPMGYVRQEVPAGYVVVGASSTPGCPYYDGDTPNTLTIRTPTSPTVMCLRWPIPMGYVRQEVPAGLVVVGATSSAACPYHDGNSPNALTVRAPASPMAMCLRWPIPMGYMRQNPPVGFAVVGASSTPGCPYHDSNIPNTLTIRTLTSPMVICMRWPIPMGYVTQNVPAGYVVVSASSSGACPYYGSTFNAYTIRKV